MSRGKVEITRLGHSMFRFVSPGGKVIVADPWITGNPTCAAEYLHTQKFSDVDLMLITHGHFDHTMGIDEVCAASKNVQIIALYELALSLMFKGKTNVVMTNIGGTYALDGINISTVSAAHTSSISDLQKGQTDYLGTSVGYVIEFENGFKVYLAGDTGLMADMKTVIADFHKPDLAILPVDGVLTMSPEQAAYATKLLGVKQVIPCHDFPSPETAPSPDGMKAFMQQFAFVEKFIGTADKFAELMKKQKTVKIIQLKSGQSVTV